MFLGIVVIINVARSAYTLWKKQDIVEEKEHELEHLKHESEELEAKYEYVLSDEYVELEAREKLGLGKEGETIVIVKQNKPQAESDNQPSEDYEDTVLSNFEQWKVLFSF